MPKMTDEVLKLWEELDMLDSQLADLKVQRDQLDDWIAEAIMERLETLRELSAQGVEPEYA